MSDKLSAVQAHITGVESLETVVSAMRGIAAARSREAQHRLAGIRACAEIIGTAISDALILEADKRASSSISSPTAHHANMHGNAHDNTSRGNAELIIVFCTEQGFVGGFNEHIISSAAHSTPHNTAHNKTPPATSDAVPAVDTLKASTVKSSAAYFIIGTRGLVAAKQHGLNVIWSAPMVAHADEVPALADRITESLYAQLDSGHFSSVYMTHAMPHAAENIDAVDHALLPLDFGRFAKSKRRFAPLVTLPIQTLLAKLAEEYIYAQLCEAIMLSFAAENDARMHAMVAARTNVHNTLDRLIGDFQRLRQEEITAEIVELSAGSVASEKPRKARHPKQVQ